MPRVKPATLEGGREGGGVRVILRRTVKPTGSSRRAGLDDGGPHPVPRTAARVRCAARVVATTAARVATAAACAATKQRKGPWLPRPICAPVHARHHAHRALIT